jgi:uncharacterized FlaG/YvyC family protein
VITADIIQIAITALWSLFAAHWLYTKRKADTEAKEAKDEVNKRINDGDKKLAVDLSKVTFELAEVIKKQLVHEYNFVTEAHVRNIYKEENKELKADMSAMKADMSTILGSLQSIQIAIGVLNGVREDRNRQHNHER